MRTQDLLTFDLRLLPTEGWNFVPPRLTEEQIKDKFWRSTVRLDNPDQPERDLMACEAAMINSFGSHLRDLVASQAQMFQWLLLQPEDKESALKPEDFEQLFRFKVEHLSYGSLNLTIGVEGADSLATFFAGNFGLFVHVLELYAPEAFVSSVPYESARRVPVSATPARYLELEHEFERYRSNVAVQARGKVIAPTSHLDQDLVQNTRPLPEIVEVADTPQQTLPAKAPSREHSRLLWVAANTSLLLPVALALAVLYFAFDGIKTEKQAMEERLKRLEERERALLSYTAIRSVVPPSTPASAAQCR